MKKGKMINPFTIVILAVCVMVAVLVSVYFVLSKDKDEETIELTGEPIEEVIIDDNTSCSDTETEEEEDIWVDREEEIYEYEDITYIGNEEISVNERVVAENEITDKDGNITTFENFHKGNTYIVNAENLSEKGMETLISGEIGEPVNTEFLPNTGTEDNSLSSYGDKISLYDVAILIEDTEYLNKPIKCILSGNDGHFDTSIYIKDNTIPLGLLLKNIYIDKSRVWLSPIGSYRVVTNKDEITEETQTFYNKIIRQGTTAEKKTTYTIDIDNHSYIFSEDYLHGMLGHNLISIVEGTKSDEEMTEEDYEIEKQYEIYLEELGELLDTKF